MSASTWAFKLTTIFVITTDFSGLRTMENVETWFRIWNYVYQKQVFIKSYIIYNLCNVSQKIANLLKKNNSKP